MIYLIINEIIIDLYDLMNKVLLPDNVNFNEQITILFKLIKIYMIYLIINETIINFHHSNLR